jgi:hypothetical protein
MNARATLLNGTTVKENGGGTACTQFCGTVSIYLVKKVKYKVFSMIN